MGAIKFTIWLTAFASLFSTIIFPAAVHTQFLKIVENTPIEILLALLIVTSGWYSFKIPLIRVVKSARLRVFIITVTWGMFFHATGFATLSNIAISFMLANVVYTYFVEYLFGKSPRFEPKE